MSQPIRNEESRSEGAAVEWPQAPQTLVTQGAPAGVRLFEESPEPVSLPEAYGSLLKILGGRGTVCVPLASSAEIPSPSQSAGDEPIGTDDIQTLWNQVLTDSNKQMTAQIGDQAKRCADDKTKKLERLLQAALSSGDLDTAMLLFASLESSQANKLAGSLMDRMHQLQTQRESLTASLSQPQNGDEKQNAQNAQSVNSKVGDINSEMTMLQTFLQDVTERKNEAQQMASNFQKTRHDTAMGIIRNMG